jgi:arsenate reductase (thioredoxin)
MALKVLFVCVENSCRSQIAEAFARKLGADAASAGSKPSGKVNPKAIAAMKARGYDLSRSESKGLAEVSSEGWDYVVTMGCGDACPLVPSRKKLDWKIPDPKEMPEDEFQKVCAMIEAQVKELLSESPGR